MTIILSHSELIILWGVHVVVILFIQMEQWINFAVFIDLSLYSAHEIICDCVQTQWVINL